MNFENKLARFMRNTGPGRFLVPVGIILVVVGIILLSLNTGNYKQTSGLITSVSQSAVTGEEDQKEYDVSFKYSVDGKEYTGTFTNLSGNYKEGEEIKVFYDPSDPGKNTNSKSGVIGIVLIAAGALATVAGIIITVKAFKKSKELDAAAPQDSEELKTAFDGIKTAPGVKEYYFRFDGNSLKPGYIVEDADRKVLFEGKMLKNALVGARTFEFNNHVTGTVAEHEVGHTGTMSYNDELFSAKSSFKFDGKNIWDVVHERGIRIVTNIHSKFPYLIYELSKNGEALARVETSSVYVHEDDEAQHKLVIPTGNLYYRFWTASEDLDSIFLTIFAISECEQTVVE